jgi:hypothetical protein
MMILPNIAHTVKSKRGGFLASGRKDKIYPTNIFMLDPIRAIEQHSVLKLTGVGTSFTCGKGVREQRLEMRISW